jgi:hypothetical protein
MAAITARTPEMSIGRRVNMVYKGTFHLCNEQGGLRRLFSALIRWPWMKAALSVTFRSRLVAYKV